MTASSASCARSAAPSTREREVLPWTPLSCSTASTPRSSVQADLAQRDQEYAALLDAGVAPDDPRTQAVTAAHHRWVSQFWTPGAEEFAGLGDLYVDHPDFKARYDAVRPGLAEYVRDAMAAYAISSLT